MPRQAYNTISRLDKERLCEVYRNGGDFLNLATQLNINRTTAYNIVRREVVDKKRGGKKSGAERKAGRKENPLVTVSNLKKELRRRLPIMLGVSRWRTSCKLVISFDVKDLYQVFIPVVYINFICSI